MMYMPPPNPRERELLVELKIQEQGRRRDNFPEDLSMPSQRRQLSRRRYMLRQLVIVLLLVVGLVILYHFFYVHF